MLPLNINNNIDLDLIPSGQMDNIMYTLSKVLDNLIPQNITNRNLFKTFDSVARHAIGIDNLRHKGSELYLVVKPEIHFVIIYVFMVSFIILIIVILRKKKVKLYEPELSEIQTEQDNKSEN